MLTTILGIPCLIFVLLFVLSVILNWEDTTNPFRKIKINLDEYDLEDNLFRPYKRFDKDSCKGFCKGGCN